MIVKNPNILGAKKFRRFQAGNPRCLLDAMNIWEATDPPDGFLLPPEIVWIRPGKKRRKRTPHHKKEVTDHDG